MALSGQKTVAAAGTAEALGDEKIYGPLMVKALDTNTGIVALGNDGAGDVTTSNGLRLAAGECVVFGYVGELSSLLLDAEVNGEGVSWIRLDA